MCFSKNNLRQGQNIDDSVNNTTGSKDPEFEYYSMNNNVFCPSLEYVYLSVI